MSICNDAQTREPQFSISKIPLRTVRPFIMDTMVLSKLQNHSTIDSESLEELIKSKIHDMIESAIHKWLNQNSDKLRTECPKPLIRLRV